MPKGSIPRLNRFSSVPWPSAKRPSAPNHPDVAVSLMNLALTYSQQGNHETAESLNKRALAILESSLGANHPEFATALNNLAEAYATQGKIVDAGRLHWRAISIREKALGPEHPAVAESYGNLAVLYELAVFYKLEGDYTKAEQLYQRSLAIWEKSAAANHLNVSKTLASYAGMKVKAGDTAGALALYRKANAGFRAKVVAGDSVGITPEVMASARDDYDSYISLLAKVAGETASAESFDVAQLRGSSATGQVVGQMAARFATGNNAIAKSVRQRQDLALQLKALDDTLIKELGKATGERNGTLIDNLRAQSAATQARTHRSGCRHRQALPRIRRTDPSRTPDHRRNSEAPQGRRSTACLCIGGRAKLGLGRAQECRHLAHLGHEQG